MSDRASPTEPEFLEALGRTVRLLRIDRELDRKELAAAAGISYSYLSAIENGQKAPSTRLLYTLARELGLRDDELLAAARERLAGLEDGHPPQSQWRRRLTFRPPEAQWVDEPSAPAAAPMAAAPPPPAVARRQTADKPAERESEDRNMRNRRRREITDLMDRLRPDDADAVIDLARRLAGRPERSEFS